MKEYCKKCTIKNHYYEIDNQDNFIDIIHENK